MSRRIPDRHRCENNEVLAGSVGGAVALDTRRSPKTTMTDTIGEIVADPPAVSPTDWTGRFAISTSQMRRSAIRELLKLTTQSDMISFAGGLPAPELFP